MKTFYYLYIWPMLAGNAFGLYNFITAKATFNEKFPSITEKHFLLFPFLSVLNIIGLAGMFFLNPWSPWIAIIGIIAAIAANIYFGIRYHLYLAVPSSIILFMFNLLF